MSLSNCGVSNSPVASILLKAKRFGIFSIFTLTAIIANPLLVKAQIAVDGSTATEVKGNVVSPVGQGTVNGGNLYHSFDKFNVPNSGVIFNTGNSSVDGTKVNNIINRVTGDTPSSILGTIESRSAFPNANLYLLNPNGVVFGANARLDIGGSFNVTTGTSLGFDQNQKFSVDKNSLSFPTGDPKNIQFAIAQPAAIINQGNLTVDAGKNISLTAGTVINTGNLTAPNGNINLAAVSGNSQVELRSPDLVLGFAVNKDVIHSNWNGTIAALPKLAELLTGRASQANQVVVKPDGTIALVASPSPADIAIKDGMNITSGKIDVSSNTSKGGNVGVFGNQVGLVNSLIDASGINGGGTVLIGGNFQGKGIAPNALQTYVDSSSKILANGLLVGDGGKVIVWADRSTQFFGAIAAKGGDISGNGGFVEVSGKQNLDYQGSVNTLAPFGKTGTLLLDPQNITVNSGINNPTELTINSAFSNPPASGTSTIANSTINAATSNVVLQATNDIFFNAPISIVASGVGLTAQAGRRIEVGNSINTNNGSVNFTVDPTFAGAATGTGNITISAPITTNGGAIAISMINAGSLIVMDNLTSGAGNITLSGIDGSNNFVYGIGIFPNSITFSNPIISSTSGAITLNGSVSRTGGTGVFISSGASITSNSGAISIAGISSGASGSDGVLIKSVTSGSTTNITTTTGNINITGNSVNSLGINIEAPSPPFSTFPAGNLNINSGSGNLTFTSDRSEFPSVGFGGSGTLTLQPFSNNVALTINGSGNNVFLGSSFLTTLSPTVANPNSKFSSVVIGNATSDNAISSANSLSISTPISGTSPSQYAPISILTAGNVTINNNITANNSLSITGTVIALGNITVGGNLSITSNSTTLGNISLGNTTVGGDLALRITNRVSQTGAITVTGNTTLTYDSNPLTETLLANYANNLGKNIILDFNNLANRNFKNLELRTTNNGASFTGALAQVNNLKLIFDNGTITLPANPVTGILTLSAQDVTLSGDILNAASANLSGGNITINGNLTTNSGGLAIANTGTLKINPSISLNLQGDLVQSGAGSVQLGGNVTNSTGVSFAQPITLIGNTTITSSGNVSFNNTIDGTQSLTVNTGGTTLFNQTIGSITPLVSVTTDSPGITQLKGNVTTSGNQSFNDSLLIGSNISLNSFSGNGNVSLGTISNAITGTPSNLTINAGTSGNITLAQVGSSSDPLGNLGLIGNRISLGNTTIGGNLTITPISNLSQTGAIAVTGITNFLFSNTSPNILLANSGNSFNGGVSFPNIASISIGDFAFRNVATGATLNTIPTLARSVSLTLDNGTINLPALSSTGGLTLSARDITLNGNISGTSVNFSGGNVTLLSNSSITSTNGNITFNSPLNGAFALALNTNGNFAIVNAAIGDTTPLTSFAIATNTTLSSLANSETSAFNPIQISTTGNISLGAISNSGANVTLRSSVGAINTGDINTSASRTGGQIFIDASQAINVGILNSSGSTRAGDVTLDPVGDVVVRAIDASSTTQGGKVTLISTGGNLRITDTLLSSTTSSCVGASICTSGGTGGNISLQTGGLNPFLVDNATLNSSKGILTTGTTTVNLGTSIPVVLSSSFIQGGIKVTPGGITTPTPTPTPTDPKQPFVRPETTPDNVSPDSKVPSDSKLPPPPEFLKQQVGNYLQQGNLPKAFDALERSYGSELEIFVGRPLNLSSTTIDESQDILAKVAQQTGDVAALIYPVLLDNRIEIMVVPPKDKGKPFRQFTVVPSQEAVESVLTDYRNNIRDVGSNDYLEQSQKLYDWIMRPIDSQLKAMKINTLVFVMDAGLRVVPPAAMHDGKQFVVERYGVASVASMRVTRIEERDRKSTRVLAMGLTDAVSGFSALPSVDVEIKTIASNILEGSSFLNKDFTVSNMQAQRQLGKYNILHLGTHGKFVSDNSGESFIQFWDSRLSLSQIPQLRFDNPAIDMLTLSACQTAVGNNLGISGLAVESGAKSVLASLWEVSDAGTAPLMISFYKSFPHAINKAQAMQQAQVSLLSGKVNIKNGEITGILGLPNIKLPIGAGEIDLSHPFYWSSFILVGNWL